MKQFFSLVKILFKSRYKFRMPSKSEPKPAFGSSPQKNDYTWVIWLVLGAVYIFFMFSLAAGVAEIAPEFHARGALTQFMLLVYVIVMLIIIIMGIINMLSYVYFNRDSEFLASLPIKSWKIFLAKLFLVYITELALSALALIPLNLTIGIVTGQGAVFYLGTLLSVFLVPALPMLLASILAVPLMFAVTFFKKRGSALTSIVVLLLVGGIFALYYYFYFNFMSMQGDDLDAVFAGLISGMKAWEIVFYPLTALIRFCLAESVFGLSPAVSALVNLAIVILCFAAITFVAGFISNLVYHKSVISQSTGAGADKANGKAEQFKSGGILGALLKKEWRALIRESSFAFQCLFGIVMGPVMTAFLASMPSMVDLSALQSTEDLAPYVGKIVSEAPALLLIFMCVFICAGTNIAACSAISREGKNFYITKTMPVPYKMQIQAKLYLSLFISLAGCLLSTVLGGIIMKLPVWQFFVIFAFLAIYSYAFACFAVKFDMAKPRLNWSTPNEAVKNSRSSTIPVLLNLVIGFLLIIIMAVFIVLSSALIMWAVMFAAVLGVACLFHIRLYKNLDAVYEAIEC